MSSPSSSSDAWSGSEPEVDQGTQPTLPNSQADLTEDVAPIRSRHGEKLPFQAPPGYLPSYFPNSLLTTFGHDTLKSSQQKQLWMIKIPEGVSPSLLDGTVMKVPSSSQSIFAEIELEATSKKSKRPAKYQLRRQLKPKAVEDNNLSTQLIQMAGGDENSIGNDFDDIGIDTRSFRLLLPKSGTAAGTYITSTKPIQEHLHLVLHEPLLNPSHTSTVIDRPDDATRKRKQPEGKLKGRFVPAGARLSERREIQIDHSPRKEKKIKTSHGASSPMKVESPQKSRKKKKSSKINA